MVKTYEDLREKTLAMTGFFETSNGYPTCYGITSGNHDGQGLSHGVLQFNFGTGSLQPLWNYMNTNYNQLCRDIFGADYAEWADVLTRTTANQVSWGDSISLGTTSEEKRQIQTKWKNYFQTLGETQPSIDKQITYSESWIPNALKWFNSLQLYSRRGFALLWDISVQMGRLFPCNLIWNDFKNISTAGKTRDQIEQEKLQIIVDRCCMQENNIYTVATQDLVRKRKQMIVSGTGDYYGAAFTMDQYDLNYDPAFRGGIYSG
jgi:hypothetical protein